MKKLLCVLAIAGMAPSAMGAVFWASARGVDALPPHQIHSFDMNGVLMNSIDQVAGAQSSAWGYRDGAYDGNLMYFGWENGLASHNADGSGGTQIFFGGAPGGVGTWRALAFDPTGDGGNGSFWVASFASNLIEVDMSGSLLNSFASVASLYGLAFDDSDGNLFGHDTDGAVVKISTADGSLMAGGWSSGFPNLEAQGGLSGYSELGGNLAAVSQGAPDELGVYDSSSGILVGGPWDMEGQTGTNGHLGIAVVPGPGALALLGLGALVSRRRRRR